MEFLAVEVALKNIVMVFKAIELIDAIHFNLRLIRVVELIFSALYEANISLALVSFPCIIDLA